MLIFYTISFLISCYVLARSGAQVVKSLTRIAAHYELSEFLVAFILVSFATTAPELFIGISSAFSKSTSLSLGNLVGANIINITLVIGLAAVLGRGIEIGTRIAQKDVYYTIIMLLIPVLLFIDQTLSRVDGLLLLLIFLLYLVHLFHSYQKRLPVFVIKALNMLRIPINGEQFHQEFETPSGKERTPREIIIESFWLVIAMLLLIVSARIIVYLGIELAGILNLPIVLLGLIIVSIGTTLPELTFGIRAVMAGRKEMILGNLFGSMTINLVFILGVVALLQPIALSFEAFRLFLVSALCMFLVLGLFSVFIRTKSKLSWQEGMVLVMCYVVFVIVVFLMR
ncbi:sodium:calcium antiporter [Patescibacteria group bacterium]|nr:sodium:calcium antiporter [Patescibacteria group bacterium]MBU4512638.1 sodium:calcium antiporter [Patescibacteria group bacterium]MCG2693544.1 sodium:calcium antiporter [Candidatus Parcubacteria bacterium]